MRTITKQDCRVIAAAVKPSQLGNGGKQIYSRLFQEAYGVPFDMVKLLMHERVPIADLAARLKMSRRTVFRYLVALEKIDCSVELTEEGYHIKRCGKTLKSLLS